MATAIKMPALSPTMEEGTLAKWLVKEGDSVSPGDILAEIETDKATMEFECIDEGTVGAITVPEGTENVKVGTVIAVLDGATFVGADLTGARLNAARLDGTLPGPFRGAQVCAWPWHAHCMRMHMHMHMPAPSAALR